MQVSNYSLSYVQISQGKMDLFRFLDVCGELGVEGASIHTRSLTSTAKDYLKRIRRAYLDNGLSVSMLTAGGSFAVPEADQEAQFKIVREAIGVAAFLGAPLLRIFAGGPANESDRERAFERAAKGLRQASEEAAKEGVAFGIQNHNHGGLTQTGEDVLRLYKAVGHPNFVFILDTGQWAGSRGAGSPATWPKYAHIDFMNSIRQTAHLASHVRVKFYNPRPDGSEPAIDYDEVFRILRQVGYRGFLDINYEGNRSEVGGQEDALTAIPRAVRFLRSKLASA